MDYGPSENFNLERADEYRQREKERIAERDRRRRKDRRREILWGFAYIFASAVVVMIEATIFFGAVYVVYHFAAKYW